MLYVDMEKKNSEFSFLLLSHTTVNNVRY